MQQSVEKVVLYIYLHFLKDVKGESGQLGVTTDTWYAIHTYLVIR